MSVKFETNFNLKENATLGKGWRFFWFFRINLLFLYLKKNEEKMLTVSKIKPDYIYRDNKAIAAVIDIDIFNEIIEKIEDDEDIAYLKEARKRPLKFRKFSEYVNEKQVI